MEFYPKVTHLKASEVVLGSLCFLPAPENRPAFGIAVEAADRTRHCDFLALATFKIWPTGSQSGITSFFVVPDAHAEVCEPFCDSVRAAGGRVVPPPGSIVFGPDGPSIVAVAGRDPESFFVRLDLKSGMLVDDKILDEMFCTRWRFVNPVGGEYRDILRVEV